MKKILAVALTAMMLAPTGVQAKGTTIKVVSKIGNDKITYNKDGLITKGKNLNLKYKNGKISQISCYDTLFDNFAMTYSQFLTTKVTSVRPPIL